MEFFESYGPVVFMALAANASTGVLVYMVRLQQQSGKDGLTRSKLNGMLSDLGAFGVAPLVLYVALLLFREYMGLTN